MERTLPSLALRASMPAATIVLLALLSFSGCSKPKFYPTRGEVIVFGVGKLTEGEIQFRPKSKPSLIAKGQIQKDGTFSVSTEGHGEGVLEGDCQVALIVPEKNGKRQINPRYADFSTAEINYTIAPRDENYFILDVKR